MSIKIPRVFLAHTQRKYGGKEGRQCELCESLSDSGPLRQRHQRRGPCWRLAVAATPAADPAATCRWLLVLQRPFSPPSSKSQNVPAMFMSHSLHLFYSYGFAVEFIDDCFSLCSNLVLSMNDSMSKFCLEVLVGLMSSLISFPVSLCSDQDWSILLYFHLNLTRKSDLFLVCSTVIFPILYTIVDRVRTYLYIAWFECLIWELQ